MPWIKFPETQELTLPRILSQDEIKAHESRLAEKGYAILERLLSDEEADELAAALQPLQEAVSFGKNDFSGFRTRRAFNLFAKTRALDTALLNEHVLALARSALGPSIQVSIASTMEIFPGETSQTLHQDDAYFRLQRPHPALVLNTMWALTGFTEANGAAGLAPGSNRYAHAVSAGEPSIAAEMPKGSVLLWDGALWHAGGANLSDQVRFGVSLNFCRGWIRQQENQYLAIPFDLARRCLRTY
jgi:hypothetical protein